MLENPDMRFILKEIIIPLILQDMRTMLKDIRTHLMLVVFEVLT